MKKKHKLLLGNLSPMTNLQTPISEGTLTDYDRLREDCGILSLTSTSLLEIVGDDRKGWLQGQATNDLRKLEPGTSSAFCLTTVTGHLLSVCEVWAVTDRLLVTCPAVTVQNILKRVEQMVILEDVSARDVSDSFKLLSIQGPTATSQLSKLMTLPSLDAGESCLAEVPVFCLRSNRTGLGGWDIWIAADAREAIEILTAAFVSVSEEAVNIARLEAGIPRFGSDMNERTFPPEMGSAFEARHVSYHKGCYMGQEVLMRIHSRGHTNRTWVGLQSEQKIELGAIVRHTSRPEAGVVTSAAFSPDYGYIGAAMVRNEAAFQGEPVKLVSESATIEAEVRIMPILNF